MYTCMYMYMYIYTYIETGAGNSSVLMALFRLVELAEVSFYMYRASRGTLICVYIYTRMYMYTYMYMCRYIYAYIEREPERDQFGWPCFAWSS